MSRRFLPKVLLALVLLGVAQPTIALPGERSDNPPVKAWLTDLGGRLDDLLGSLLGAGSAGPPPEPDGPSTTPSEGVGSLDPTSYEEPPSSEGVH